jgi:2-hydroxychromene-2-carboxylate isomerase
MRFYFDFVSPYAYLAWTQMMALAREAQRELHPIPILFAGCLKAHGHKGPAEIPSKRRYVAKNIFRVADALGVPLQPPRVHPFNPLLPLRVCSLQMPASTRQRLITRLFEEVWARGQGVSEAVAVAAIVDEVGLDASGAAAVEEAGHPEVKERLREQTEEAIELGVFGVPTIEVDGELFWGVDALSHVLPFLRGEDPVNLRVVESWIES